jgi:hypothetical protein
MEIALPFRPRPKNSNASDAANTARLPERFIFSPAPAGYRSLKAGPACTLGQIVAVTAWLSVSGEKRRAQ